MPAVDIRGRWVWGLSGLVVIGLIWIPASRLATHAGNSGGAQPLSPVPTRTVTVKQQVTSLSVQSYGAPIQVTGAPVRHTTVVEAIRFGPGLAGPPAVTDSLSQGRLTLAAPACDQSDCSVGFTITVPRDVAVTAEGDGGPVTVSGVAAADLDSGGGVVRVSGVRGALTVNADGGPVIVSAIAGGNLDSGDAPLSASDVSGPLTVNTEGAGFTLNGLTGPLHADTGGGPLLARDIAAVTVSASTEGGDTDIGFITAPQAVTVDTGGGDARLWFGGAPRTVTLDTEGGGAVIHVPGGPFALSVQTEGGPQDVGIAASPAATRTIAVDSGGGPVWIEPGTGTGA